MIDSIENYNLTNDEISEIKFRVINNKATESDYKKLDFFLSSINLGGYILKNMTEKGYLSYKSFVDQKNTKGIYKTDKFNEAYIDGIVMECINMLHNFITK